MDTDTLCNNIADQEILFQIYRYSSAGNHKMISSAITTLEELKSNQNTTIAAHKGEQAKLHVVGFKVQPRVSFLDYIFGGCEIGVHVVIDFTSSNRPADDPYSLHYLDQYGKNDYIRAIEAVLGIL